MCRQQMNCYFVSVLLFHLQKNYQNSLKRALLRRKKLDWPRLIWPTRPVQQRIGVKFFTMVSYNFLVFLYFRGDTDRDLQMPDPKIGMGRNFDLQVTHLTEIVSKIVAFPVTFVPQSQFSLSRQNLFAVVIPPQFVFLYSVSQKTGPYTIFWHNLIKRSLI